MVLTTIKKKQKKLRTITVATKKKRKEKINNKYTDRQYIKWIG